MQGTVGVVQINVLLCQAVSALYEDLQAEVCGMWT